MSGPRNVLIIGASRGIGLGLVEKFLSVYPSATVYAAVRDIPKAVELQQVVNLSKGRVQLLRIESGDPSSFKLAAAEIATKTQSLDFVIYNSGVLRGWGNVLEVGIEPLKENIETNVYGAYHAAVEFSPFLLKSGFQNKSLVFVSSTFASLSLPIFEEHQAFGMPGCDPTAMYNISKTALNRLGKEIDGVLRHKGVPVLLLHPGLVKTDMNPQAETTIEESVTGMVDVIRKFSIGDKHIYIGFDAERLPW